MTDTDKNLDRIGILVVAHGSLAAGLISAAEEILGPQAGVCPLRVDPTCENPKKLLIDKAKEVDSGAGILALTDLFGGTPANVAIAASPELSMDVITGVNLPILMRALLKRETLSLSDLTTAIAEYGRAQILTPNQMLERAAS